MPAPTDEEIVLAAQSGEPVYDLLEERVEKDLPCSRPGCGRPLSEHDHGIFCP